MSGPDQKSVSVLKIFIKYLGPVRAAAKLLDQEREYQKSVPRTVSITDCGPDIPCLDHKLSPLNFHKANFSSQRTKYKKQLSMLQLMKANMKKLRQMQWQKLPKN